jgi:hypothetical protein
MKTAEQYLRDAIGYERTGTFINYQDALEAVQAVIDDAGSVRQQVREALAEYFEPLLPELPALAPVRPAPTPIANVFPPACPRCLQRGAECLCPPMFPREEPPF